MSEEQNNFNPSGEVSFGVFKKKRKRRKRGDPGSLNINSMMDIMTILLVFLLVSVTSDPLSINQNTELRLAKMAGGCGYEIVDGVPKAICKRAYRPPDDSIPITVTKKTILVDNQDIDVRIDCKTISGVACTEADLITKFKCGQQEDDLSTDPCSADEMRRMNSMKFYVDRRLKQGSSDDSFLIEKLGKELEEKVKEIREGKSDDERFVPAATIIADADIPFRVIAEVIYTAGMAKLTDMRFALLQRDSR